MKLKIINNIIAIIFWIIGLSLLAVKLRLYEEFLVFIPFTLGIHAMNHLLILLVKDKNRQKLLTFAMAAYFIWFLIVYYNAYQFTSDGHYSIILLFTSFDALPIALPIWIAVYLIGKKTKQEPEPEQIQPSPK